MFIGYRWHWFNEKRDRNSSKYNKDIVDKHVKILTLE